MTSTDVQAPLLRRFAARTAQLTARLTTPLLPEDYLGVVNPLWDAGDPCGRVVAVRRETADSASLFIRPGRGWRGHRAGQWVRIGVDINGVRHHRTFSLSDAQGRRDGNLRITVRVNPDGVVSRHLVHGDVRGTVVWLAPADGDFVLPEDTGTPLLFITAGSGITPVIAMLSELSRTGARPDVVVLHSERTPRDVILGSELRALALSRPGITLHEQHTRKYGRLDLAEDLDRLCPDWRDRLAYVCGPEGLLDAATEHWADAGLADSLKLERFRPKALVGGGADGGGKVCFSKSGVIVEADGDTPLLEVGEEAGALLPSGCRMGICFSCVGKLSSGQVRDLRTGVVHGEEGDLVQTCISAAAGPVALDL